MVSIALYLGAFCLALYWLHRQSILSMQLGILVTLSWLLTLPAAYYSYLTQVADAYHYFTEPDVHLGVSTRFVVWLTQTVIKPLAGGSYFLTYLAFAAIGFMGRVFAVMVFYRLGQNDRYLSDFNNFFRGRGQWVCALLLLWPTVIFWGSLLGKDSLQYGFLFLFLLGLMTKSWYRWLFMSISLVMLLWVRPYNAALLTLGFVGMLVLGRFQWHFRLIGLAAVSVVAIIADTIMRQVYQLSLFDLNHVMVYGLGQQMKQHHGTAIAMHIHHWYDYWLSLPWTMFANMFLPLPGWYTTNLHAWLAAFTNCVFIYIVVQILLWLLLARSKLKQLKYFNLLMFLLSFCFAGFLLLAVTNTNLGLADRQKMPYVTMLLLIYGAITYLSWRGKRESIVQAKVSPQPKKLLFIIADDAYFLSHRLSLAQYIKQQGWQVVVACGNTGQLSQIRAYGFDVIGFDYDRTQTLADFKLFFTLRRIIKQQQPDIIHNVALRVVFVSMLVCKSLWGLRNLGKVNAIMGLGHLFTKHGRVMSLLRWCVMQILGWLLKDPNSRVIVQNQDDYKALIRQVVPSEQIILIKGSGVDLAYYPQRVHQMETSVVHVAMASRLIEPKGVFEFYQTARLLAKQGYTNVHFHLYGKTHPANPQSLDPNKLNSWSYGLTNFTWHGYVEHMPSIYQQTDIVVLPSYYREGVPKCLIEAAACAVPIITTDTPGCHEICLHQVNGLLVSPKDVEGLAEAIKYLVNYPYQINAMGQAGRRIVKQSFTAQMVNLQTWLVYQSILNHKSLSSLVCEGQIKWARSN